MKIKKNFENIFFQLKITATWYLFYDLEVYSFANIPNFIVERDSEIRIGCYRGLGGDYF